MAIALAREKLSLNDTQIHELSTQIRHGDLTPVLRIYEEDIKSPVRKALTGSLIRSLLIQIQKAKVDLDQALSGIDKLLKSQELTFAFVGVAPSLAIVYTAFNGARTLWEGRRGNKRLGGRRERQAAWLAIRRVERLLITEPNNTTSNPNPASKSETISQDAKQLRKRTHDQLSHTTSGLLVVALARLRAFAEQQLPARSLLRAEILADIRDLEDPRLLRAEKLRVVDRMWRSFGGVLGWGSLGRVH
jgi:nuclear control of ATPase protein 2